MSDDSLPEFTDRGEGHKSNRPVTDSRLEAALFDASPQLALVLEYLASGRGLSGLIAHTVLGVTSLTTRVAELRKLGIPIRGDWHRDHSGKRFMVYHYAPNEEAPGDQPLQNVASHPVLPEGHIPVYTFGGDPKAGG